MKILLLLFGVITHQAFGLPASHAAGNIEFEFQLSAESLPCKDIVEFYKQPDAYVSIYSYQKSPGLTQEEPKKLGSTSTIRDDNNPEWSDKFPYTWINGTGQTLRFRVFDHDRFSQDDHIGDAEVSVDHFMESGGTLKVNLSDKAGSLIMTRQRYHHKQIVPIAFKLSAQNLPPRDRFLGYQGESDPYAVITYQKGKLGRVFLYQTGIFTDNSNPSWPRLIEFTKYEPNTNQTLSFELYDRDILSEDEFLGRVTINADELYETTGKVIRYLRDSNGFIIKAKITLETFPPPLITTTESELYETTEESKVTTIPTTVTPSISRIPTISTTASATTFSTATLTPNLMSTTEDPEFTGVEYEDYYAYED